jgi:acetyl-CoA synthetase (ADP-forming)
MGVTLSEHESKRLLREAGIDLPEERLVETPEQAVAAARELGGAAVALKLCGRGLAHKSERGAVRLELDSPERVRREAEALLALRRPEDGDCGLLVARMVRGRRELIAGLTRDRQFGPCVMLGLGGVLAELLGDVAFALAPLREGDALELCQALRHRTLLRAFRGEPPADLAALARILDALGRLGAAREEIRSVDLNPIILEGARPVIVDALVELEEAAA